MKEDYLTIKQTGNHELIIKKSRFIATIARTKSVNQAEQFITATSHKYHDATHNTYAYTLGLDDRQVKASDNGEPSGTAGVPELKALQLMKLKNVTVVVTRYFGGIKLGAGGLIRAYSNSVTEAVSNIGVVRRVLQQELIFQIPYNRLDEVKHFLQQKNIYIANINYGINVEIHLFTDIPEQEAVKSLLTNLLAGKISFTQGQSRYNEIDINEHDYHNQ
ncbi:YigZ family protein [Lactobacillus sp. ESL0684]|uniref:YigZ family protein n=1 Tax=Lactobacillus sp. ESL0684 TaxID=2983213 RepID=UPI0023F6D72C|nr:YigZ family protein [Lactobacillus sp. ESL0684]WEV43119.1 YigZ family protein [Lactobacillus sp. ESL0684]